MRSLTPILSAVLIPVSLAIGICLLLAGLWLQIANQKSKPGATRVNFAKIQRGMSKAEVEALLGKQIPSKLKGRERLLIVEDESPSEALIDVRFVDGQVENVKVVLPQRSSLSDRIKNWLGF